MPSLFYNITKTNLSIQLPPCHPREHHALFTPGTHTHTRQPWPVKYCSHVHKSPSCLRMSQGINCQRSNMASTEPAALEPPASGVQRWHIRRKRQGSATDTFQGSFDAENVSKDTATNSSARQKPTVQPSQVEEPSQLVKALFSNIKRQSLEQLQYLLDNHIHQMDAEVLVAALVRLAKLRTPSAAQAAVKQAMQQTLWLRLKPVIETCRVQDLALTLWAASKLQMRYPAVYRLCLRHFVQQLDTAPARHISNVMYALAAAPAYVKEVAVRDTPSIVYKRLLPAFLQTVESSEANTQDISNVLWAVATLQLQPRSADLRSMLNSMLDQIEDAAPVSLSNTLWSLARLKYRPSQQLLLKLLQQLVLQADHASAHDASNALWALTNMQLPPGLQQRQQQQQQQEVPGHAFEQAVVRLLQVAAAPARGRGSPREACSALWAAAKLDVAVAERQVVQIVQIMQKAVRQDATAEPQDISNLLWSLARIHSMQQQKQKQEQEQLEQQQVLPTLQQEQLDVLLAALARASIPAKPQAIVNSIYAAAKLGLTVQYDTLVALVDAFLGKLDYASPQEVANMLWALATLQQQQQQQQGEDGNSNTLSAPGAVVVPHHVTKLLVGRLVTKLEHTKSQEVANSLWAVAKLGQQVTPRQLRLLLSHLATQLPAVQAQEIASTLWATATMCQASKLQMQQGQQQPAGQLQRLLSALADYPGGLQGLSQQTICNALWAAAQLLPCIIPQWLLPQRQEQQQFMSLIQQQSRLQQQQQRQHSLDALIAHVPLLNLQAASVWAYALGQLGAVEAEQLLVAVLQRGNQLALQLSDSNGGSSSSSSSSSSTNISSNSGSSRSSNGVLVAGVIEAPGASNVAQALAVMCWSGAVIGLHQPQHVQLLRQLAAAYSRHWQQATYKDMCQVYMLHMWLSDLPKHQQQQQQPQGTQAVQQKDQPSSSSLLQQQQQQQQQSSRRRRRLTHENPSVDVSLDTAGHEAGSTNSYDERNRSSSSGSSSSSHIAAAVGLQGCLDQEQLQQCHAAWLQQLDKGRSEAASQLQQAVFAAAQQLTSLSGAPVLESMTDDALFSIDIAATAASGQRLAIEVDGPVHFRLPDRGLTGTTLFRDKALAARGYVVVSVPYFGWKAAWKDEVYDEQGAVVADAKHSEMLAVAVESSADGQQQQQHEVPEQQVQYLQQLVEEALAGAQRRGVAPAAQTTELLMKPDRQSTAAAAAAAAAAVTTTAPHRRRRRQQT